MSASFEGNGPPCGVGAAFGREVADCGDGAGGPLAGWLGPGIMAADRMMKAMGDWNVDSMV